MVKKIIFAGVIILLLALLISPSQLYAEESKELDEIILYTTPEDETLAPDYEDQSYYNTISDDESELYDYDWEKAWDTSKNVEDLTEEETLVLGAIGAMLTGVLLIVLIATSVVCYIYFALTLMVTANKLKVPNAWLAWIPLANLVTVVQTAGVSNWGILWLLIPGVNIVYGAYVYMQIAQRRGFESWIGLLVLVPFVGIIVPGYIAWGEPKKNTTATEQVAM
jgi:hypothetical protein